MWTRSQESHKGTIKFFLLSLSHIDMISYYKTNFLLMYKHKFSITELEDMIPYERDVYISLLENYIEEQNKKNK